VLVRAASQAWVSAHSPNSRSTFASQASASSCVSPSEAASTWALSRSPWPTMFVRRVLSAPVASGVPMYRSRDRSRSVTRFSVTSWSGLPPSVSQPSSDFFVRLAPWRE